MILGLDHVGIAVNRVDSVLQLYEKLLGLKLERIESSERDMIRAAILVAGNTKIELIEPLGETSRIRSFLENQGEGLHHIAFKVDNIEEMLRDLEDKGVVLIDKKPRTGVEGGKIAFLHPKSTGRVLIELNES